MNAHTAATTVITHEIRRNDNNYRRNDNNYRRNNNNYRRNDML